MDARAAPPSDAGFLTLAEPLVEAARRDIRDALARAAPCFPCKDDDQDALIASMEEPLSAALRRVLTRTLVVELAAGHQAGLLVGATATERFRFFTACLADPAFGHDILDRYPALARLVVGTVADWRAFALRFIDHAVCDHAALRENAFGSRDQGPIVAIRAAGDSHRGGLSSIVRFRSGARLAYKPRPLAIEQAFRQFVGWLNARHDGPPLATPRILDRGGHGWAEFIAHAPCADAAGVKRFFWRQGGNLALLHLLGAVDLHSENIIARGEEPFPVDLETLFHPTFTGVPGTNASRRAEHAVATSVMATLLLPMPISAEPDEAASIDLSGLGDDRARQEPIWQAVWDRAGTDAMRLVPQRAALPLDDNLPVLDGQRMASCDHVDDVVAGLDAIHRTLQDNKAALGEALACFKGTTSRIVVRPTWRYGALLEDSFDPAHLRTAAARHAMLHAGLQGDVAACPWLAPLIGAELRDLTDGQIPLFQGRVGTRRLQASDGTAVAIDSMSDTWSDCLARVEALGEPDLRLQRWLTRVTLTDTLRARRPHAAAAAVAVDAPRKRGRATTRRPLMVAMEIGDRLVETAFRGKHGACWVSADDAPGGRLVPTLTGVDLYSGLPGIALALGYLGHVSGKPHYTTTARAAIREAVDAAADRAAFNGSVGAFEGTGGLIYALGHLGWIWNDPSLIAAAERLAVSSVESMSDCRQVDVIAGWAGFALAVLSLDGMIDRASLRDCAAFAEQKLQTFMAWFDDGHRDPDVEIDPVSVAHGEAGVGWALVRASEVIGDARVRARGIALLEREFGRWQSAPVADPEDAAHASGETSWHASSATWCHGPAGVALAALWCGDTAWRASTILHGLVRTILRAREGRLSLCHGDLGAWDLVDAARRTGRVWTPRHRAFEYSLIARAQKAKPTDDLLYALDVPGLMTGAAGVVYGLLRLTDPDRVPSVLALEGPRRE